MEELLFFEARADLVVEVKGAGRIIGGRVRVTSLGFAFTPVDPSVPPVRAPLAELGAVQIEGASRVLIERGEGVLDVVLEMPLALESAIEQARKWQADRAIYR